MEIEKVLNPRGARRRQVTDNSFFYNLFGILSLFTFSIIILYICLI